MQVLFSHFSHKPIEKLPDKGYTKHKYMRCIRKEGIFMTMKEIATGLQHIGVPTGDMDATIHFYHALGFETIFETVNAEAGGRVNFFKLGDLVIEPYEVTDPAKAPGAVDHMAINVKDIEEAFRFVNEAGLNNTNDIIHSLPFFENGVKFFTIEGANKEKVEFNQFL